MTIFTAIKYPISVPPTAGELRALPHDLFRRWRTRIGFASDWTPADMSDWFRNIKDDKLEEIVLLRRMIVEYEE